MVATQDFPLQVQGWTESFKHRYTPRKDGQQFCALPSPLVAPCISTGLFWLVLPPPVCSRPSSPRITARTVHGTRGSRQHQALLTAMPQTPRVAIQQHRGKQHSVSTSASTERRMVTCLLLRERFQTSFQPPYHRYR